MPTGATAATVVSLPSLVDVDGDVAAVVDVVVVELAVTVTVTDVIIVESSVDRPQPAPPTTMARSSDDHRRTDMGPSVVGGFGDASHCLGTLAGMKRKSFEDMDCPIAQSLELVGEWWTPLILRDIVMFGLTRFDDIQTDLGTTASNLPAYAVVTDRDD